MNSKSFLNQNRGFTLVEIMAAVALFGMLIVMVLTIFNKCAQTFREAESHTEKIIGGRMVLDMIVRDLKSALFDDTHSDIELVGGVDPVTNSSWITFVAPAENYGSQQLCQIGYWVYDHEDPADTNSYELMKFYATDSNDTADWDSFDFADWDISEGRNYGEHRYDLAVNIRRLEIWYWGNSTTSWNNSVQNWDSSSGPDVKPRAILIEVTVGDPRGFSREEVYTAVVALENARHNL
jgi:prepilin-type N-terminal cleavage/methylation domain-containing protein